MGKVGSKVLGKFAVAFMDVEAVEFKRSLRGHDTLWISTASESRVCGSASKIRTLSDS